MPVSVPYVFVPNTIADPNQVNADFAALVAAFNGPGGTPVNPGVVNLQGSGLILAYGKVLDVPADGSASVTVTYAEAFPTESLSTPLFGLDTGSSTVPVALTPQSLNTTQFGFTLLVSGGAPGSTVTVTYGVLGY